MKKPNFNNLKAVFVNCTLKKSPATSRNNMLFQVVKNIMEKENVTVEGIRLIDHEVATGVQPDMTEHGWDNGSRWKFENPEYR